LFKEVSLPSEAPLFGDLLPDRSYRQ
jgi:hypothetical protein